MGKKAFLLIGGTLSRSCCLWHQHLGLVSCIVSSHTLLCTSHCHHCCLLFTPSVLQVLVHGQWSDRKNNIRSEGARRTVYMFIFSFPSSMSSFTWAFITVHVWDSSSRWCEVFPISPSQQTETWTQVSVFVGWLCSFVCLFLFSEYNRVPRAQIVVFALFRVVSNLLLKKWVLKILVCNKCLTSFIYSQKYQFSAAVSVRKRCFSLWLDCMVILCWTVSHTNRKFL